MLFTTALGLLTFLCLSVSTPLSIKDRDEYAALKAATYLLEHGEYLSWGTITPRVLTALSFLEKLKIPTGQLAHVLKQELKEVLEKDLTAVQLAHYINGLYATCQDPRDFEGKDLVEALREGFDKAEKTNFKLPLIILTLCIAREATLEDSELLANIYDFKNDLALKALAMIAMAACRDLTTIPYLNMMKSRLSDFLHRSQKQFLTTGIANKALVIQAYNSWNIDSSTLKEQLLSSQDENGSFGNNLLATASAIPGLLNNSLANLQCKRNYKAKKSSAFQSHGADTYYMDLTLIVQEGENIGRHTIRLFFSGRMSLFNLMLNAAHQSTLYRFETDEIEGVGKRISAIGGIAEDPESGIKWVLYKRTRNAIINDVPENMLKETNDVVDFIYPQDGDHYLFQLETD